MKKESSGYTGNKLRKYRMLAGYTQKNVAYLVGANNAAMVGQWERGEFMPDTPYLLMLSVLYHVEVLEMYPKLTKRIEKELAAGYARIAKAKARRV